MIIAFNAGFWHHGYHRQVTMGVLSYAAGHPEVRLYIPESGDGLFIRQEMPERIDGVIGTPLPPDYPKADGLPVVNVFEHPVAGCVHVFTDHLAIARMAFGHFRERGLRHLAVLDSARFCGVRCQPFVKVCEDHSFIPYAFRYGGRHIIETKEAQHKRLTRQLKDLPKPAGLFLTLDNHYADILEICGEAGIRVPEDLAILGVNNDPEHCLNCRPSLSSIDPHGEKIGYLGMEILVEMIRGAAVPDEIPIPPREVVTRESTSVIQDEHPNVAKALDFLHMNIAEPLQVDDLVACQSLGRRGLEKKFRSACGLSINQYLLTLRLEKIRHLLETTGLTVKKIGEQCGMPDPSYLCLCFRKAFGMPPREYRRRVVGKES